MDILFFLFHAVMWIWLVIIWWKDEYFKQCSDPVNLFGFVYLILGAVAFLMLIISFFGCLIGLVRPEQVHSGEGLYDGEVDFDPYQE